jgi:hypothetical protein
MSQEMLVALTVVEIVALVAVLALFLILITSRLRSIAETLGHVAGGASTIESHVRQVGPGAAQINKTLSEIVAALPGIAQKASTLADNVEKSRAQPAGGAKKTKTKFTYYDRNR